MRQLVLWGWFEGDAFLPYGVEAVMTFTTEAKPARPPQSKIEHVLFLEESGHAHNLV
ncbi:MAG: hypothetical protein II954_00975 [Synergistaceae bacterium]|nr:hypothetical protein [Synergistaceae bacterium]